MAFSEELTADQRRSWARALRLTADYFHQNPSRWRRGPTYDLGLNMANFCLADKVVDLDPALNATYGPFGDYFASKTGHRPTIWNDSVAKGPEDVVNICVDLARDLEGNRDQ